MSKQIIAVDIDDVLGYTVPKIVGFSNERWGTKLTPAHFNERLPEMWGITQAEAEERWAEFLATDQFSQVEPIPEAVEVLEFLQKSYRLIPLTSRREHLQAVTQAWVDRHLAALLEPVQMVGIKWGVDPHAWKVTKASAINEMGAAYLIDDQLKHCLGVAETGSRAVLFGDYPWNQLDDLPRGVTRCSDWSAVRKYFENELQI